jgi:hypothetical protein
MAETFRKPFRNRARESAGRDAPLSAYRYALDCARARAPANPIIFSGRRGMGKTALLRCAADAARADGAIVIAGEATRDEPLAAHCARPSRRRHAIATSHCRRTTRKQWKAHSIAATARIRITQGRRLDCSDQVDDDLTRWCNRIK